MHDSDDAAQVQAQELARRIEERGPPVLSESACVDLERRRQDLARWLRSCYDASRHGIVEEDIRLLEPILSAGAQAREHHRFPVWDGSALDTDATARAIAQCTNEKVRGIECHSIAQRPPDWLLERLNGGTVESLRSFAEAVHSFFEKAGGMPMLYGYGQKLGSALRRLALGDCVQGMRAAVRGGLWDDPVIHVLAYSSLRTLALLLVCTSNLPGGAAQTRSATIQLLSSAASALPLCAHPKIVGKWIFLTS
ncbi:MAG: hypothetical protein ABIG71_02040 [Candidatus Uhrbacteria bacterium]